MSKVFLKSSVSTGLATACKSVFFHKMHLCAVAIILLIGVAGCSGADDYEVFSCIRGSVTDYQTGELLENAVVTLSPSGLSQQTNADGFYEFYKLDAQQYTLTVQKAGYQPNRKTVVAVSGETHTVDIQLTAIPK